MTRVVNRRREPFDVYIGRGSRWGNPFSHLPISPGSKFVRSVANREEAIEQYREHLWSQLKSGDVTLRDLAELEGKTLGCYCKPAACHGDVLVRAVEWATRVLASDTCQEPPIGD